MMRFCDILNVNCNEKPNIDGNKALPSSLRRVGGVGDCCEDGLDTSAYQEKDAEFLHL